MYAKKAHTIITVLLVTFLISAKFAAYHSLSHEDECIECCAFCESAIILSQAPAMISDPIGSEYHLTEPIETNVQAFFPGEQFHATALLFSLFSRPPPLV
ncbi:hypothetical protein [Robertkochia flava]|uniref:hypothetical protein n=1 Tax=Robertkochia flava TaxID=3447986 RepID=UPI001CCD4C3B|nr:hypothetical protein [Robertkochia marina]